MNFSTEIGSSDGNTSEKVPLCSHEIQFEYRNKSELIKTERSEEAMNQTGAVQSKTYPKMDAKISKKLSCSFTFDKIMNRASGIYYDDLIQVKSLCDDQVCMILI